MKTTKKGHAQGDFRDQFAHTRARAREETPETVTRTASLGYMPLGGISPFCTSSPTRVRASEAQPSVGGTAAELGSTPPRREAKILSALAELGQLGVDKPDHFQVAFFAGYYHPSSSRFAGALSATRAAGLVHFPAPGRIALTAQGRLTARAPAQPRTPAELLDRLQYLLGGVHARVLQPLAEAYPHALGRDELAKRAGYSSTSNTGFTNALDRLRSLRVVANTTRGRIRMLFKARLMDV